MDVGTATHGVGQRKAALGWTGTDWRAWRPRGGLRLHALILGLCVAAGALFAYRQGQDLNYDQLNYHYYIAYAFWTGRTLQDVAPGQVMHSFFNPVVYLPFYVMERHLPPAAVGTILGAAHGLNLWLVFCIALTVTRRLPPGPRILAVAAAMGISIASPQAISEIGSTEADLLTSIPILAGLAILLRSEFGGGRRVAAAAWIGLAGVLVGLGIALKLSNGAFAVGLAAASLVGWSAWRDRLTAILAAGLGGIAGLAAGGGYWFWVMWRSFGNPLFPYYNNIFHSPDFPSAHALYDTHYLPDSVWRGLSYPFLWMSSQHATGEIPFRDIRFGVLILLCAAGVGARWLLPARLAPASLPGTAAGRRLILFVLISLCVWIDLWSIQRYIIVLELLSGPAMIVALDWLGAFRAPRAGAVAAAALAVACLMTMRGPRGDHVGWTRSWYTVDVPPNAGAHPVYFLAGEPLSFVVPFLKPSASAIGYVPWEDVPAWGDTFFQRRIKALLADRSNDPLVSVSAGPPSEDFRRAAAVYGLKIESPCQTTGGRPWPLTWCILTRTTPAG